MMMNMKEKMQSHHHHHHHHGGGVLALHPMLRARSTCGSQAAAVAMMSSGMGPDGGVSGAVSGAVNVSGGGVGGGVGGGATAACVETILRLAGESAVVVFSVSTCCMCHVAKQLLGGLGVNLTVYEVDEVADGRGGAQLMAALSFLVGGGVGGVGGAVCEPVPAIFVGGKLVGGLDHVMAAHISGALIPLLKQAGALWL